MLNRLREHFRSILKCHSIIFTYCRVFGKNKIDKFCVAAVFNSLILDTQSPRNIAVFNEIPILSANASKPMVKSRLVTPILYVSVNV